ncbi:hypothetical protein CR162_17575, partial [Pseudoroseomonas rhizosphaerae]
MSLKKALLAATVLALPLAAQAQPVTGVYVGAGAGYNYLQDSDISVSGAGALGTARGPSRKLDGEFDNGFGGVISLGYGFGNGVRVELEGNYRENDVDTLSTVGGPLPGIGGTVRSYGAMANAFYDFNIGLPVVPYIGAGAGYVWHDYDTVRSRGNAGNAGLNSVTIDDDEGKFAFQGIVGAAFPIAAVPGLALTAEYRFLGTLQPEMTAVSRSATGAVSRAKVEVDNYNHSAFI